MKKLSLSLLLSLLFAMPVAVLGDDDLKPYPPARKGIVRHVLRLPERDQLGVDTPPAQVQMLVGRTVQFDPPDGRSYRFNGGRIIAKTIRQGEERYPYWTIRPLRGMDRNVALPSSFLAKIPEDLAKQRFISNERDYFIPYPYFGEPIVVYAPEGVEVKYRILRPEPKEGDLKPYPPAGNGMARHVFLLPQLSDEVAVQVELLTGKTVWVDSNNLHRFLNGRITEVKPESATWYQVEQLGGMVSTKMVRGPMVKRFVLGDARLIQYNSRAPIVVYAPEDVEVKYRILPTDPEMNAMEPG